MFPWSPLCPPFLRLFWSGLFVSSKTDCPTLFLCSLQSPYRGLNKAISVRHSWREWWKKIRSFRLPSSLLFLFFLGCGGRISDLGLERHGSKSQVCSREIQIKVHFMPAWQAQSEERDVWVKMPQEPSPPAGGNVNRAQLLWGKLWQSLKG